MADIVHTEGQYGDTRPSYASDHPTRGFLGNLATFAVTQTIASLALGKVGQLATKAIATAYPALKIAATEGFAGAVGKFMSNRYPRMAESAVIRGIQDGHRAYDAWTKTVQGTAQTLRGHPESFLQASRSFLARDGNLRNRIIGAGIKGLGHTLEGSAGMYAADWFLSDRKDRAAWYNLPGHAAAYARLTASQAPFAFVMAGGVKIAGKAAKTGLLVAAKPIAEMVATPEQWIQGLQHLNRGVGVAMAGGQALRNTIEHLQKPPTPAISRHPFNPGEWAAWRTGVRDSFKRSYKDHLTKYFGPEEEYMEMLSGVIRGGNKSALRSIRHAEKTWSGHLIGGLEYPLGLRRGGPIDTWLTNANFEPYTRDLKQAEREAFERNMLKVRGIVRKRGFQVAGVYRGPGNQPLDLRNLSWNRIRNFAADMLETDSFPFRVRIPFSSIITGSDFHVSVPRLFMIPQLLRNTRYHEWNKESIFIGVNPTGRDTGYLYRTNPSKSPLATGGFYTPDDFGGKGVFSGGNIFHRDERGHLKQIVSPRAHFKMFHDSRVMHENILGMAGKTQTKGWAQEPGLKGILGMWFDINRMEQQGVFGVLRNYLGRFSGPTWWSDATGGHHPSHLYQNLEALSKTPDNARYVTNIIEGFHELTIANVRNMGPGKIREVLGKVSGRDTRTSENMLGQLTRAWNGYNNPLLKEIGREFGLEKIINEVEKGRGFSAMNRILNQPAGANRTGHEALADWLALRQLVSTAKLEKGTGQLRNLMDRLMKEGSVDAKTAAQINVLGSGIFINREELLYRRYVGLKPTIHHETVDKLVDALKQPGLRQDFERTTDILYANPIRNMARSVTNDVLPYDAESHRFSQSAFTMVPWGIDGSMSTKEMAQLAALKGIKGLDRDAMWSASAAPMNRHMQPLTVGRVMWNATVMRFTHEFKMFGLRLDPTRYQGGGLLGGMWQALGGPGSQLLLEGVLAKRVLPLAGAAIAWNTMDQMFDAIPGPHPFNEGVTPFLMDQMVRGRMGLQWLYDHSGLTSAAKYMEGLFPGSVDSPLMRFARGVAVPLLASGFIGNRYKNMQNKAAWAPLFGLALGGMQGFGMFDLTKTGDELADIYSGREEVPIRKGRWWELSSGPYVGGRIQAFKPHYFAKMRAQYRSNTDDLGGPLEQMLYKPWPFLDVNPIGLLLGGAHHYAYRHQHSRPYGSTGAPFRELPFIGPAVASTLGRVLAPPRPMHEEELSGALGRAGYMSGGTVPMNGNPSNAEYARVFPASQHAVRQMIGDTLYNMHEMAGLWGFGAASVAQSVAGWQNPSANEDVIATANEMTSMSRSYYGMELGGLMSASEAFRRIVPKRQREINYVNPLRNRQPKWMPIRFQIGDAYTSIPDGEVILPGRGYSRTHDVNMTFPVAAEWLGLPANELVKKMLSMSKPDAFTRRELETINLRQQAASLIHEPFNDVYGTANGIVRKGRRAVLQKIKDMGSDELSNAIGPKETDISEMNFYLRMAGVASGEIIYKVDGMPVLSYPVEYSEQRFQRDMENVERARHAAQGLHAKGVGFEGEGYSHADRALILASAAPYSNEYKYEIQMAKKELQLGKTTQEKFDKIKRHQRATSMGKEFYPHRFLGKVMSPDVAYNQMNLNENIKAAANYNIVERTLGAAWEWITGWSHPLDKLAYYKTPLEAYKQETLYGRAMKLWNQPIEGFIEPYMRGFLGKTGPGEGALAGAIAAYSFTAMAPTAAIVYGATAGAAYGTIHGAFRAATGTTYIPGSVKEQREIVKYFDQLRYAKALRLYQETGDDAYMEEARSTMTGLDAGNLSKESWRRMYAATPSSEKPYIMAFIKEMDPTERSRILKYVPEDVGDMLRAKWSRMDGAFADMNRSRSSVAKLPGRNWAGWHSAVDLDDVELQTVEREGFNAHDFGMGYQDQMRRIENTPNLPGPINLEDPTDIRSNDTVQVMNPAELRRSLERILSSMGKQGVITIAPSYHENTLTVS